MSLQVRALGLVLERVEASQCSYIEFDEQVYSCSQEMLDEWSDEEKKTTKDLIKRRLECVNEMKDIVVDPNLPLHEDETEGNKNIAPFWERFVSCNGDSSADLKTHFTKEDL